MLSSTTKKKIDTARDILVGKIPMPTSQVEQITLALIYKFMSDMDKKTKDLGDTSGFFANGYEKYAWDKLMNKALPARDRVLLYREALEKMALNPHIPQLFRDIFRNASLPFNDPETLKLFLDVIDQFEYDHSEELGNAFEYLLQVMGSQGDAGQFRTPRHIIDFIVEVVDPQKTDTILDPACGTAGFLISAYKHLRKNGLTNEDMEQVSKNFVGYDISQDMQRLSLVNMYLHHFPDPHIYEYDSLSSEDRWNDDFDVILANPPFMTPKGGIRPHNRFSVPSNRAEVLFVDYIMEHLTTNGKAGVIVPEGIIFQSQNAYKALRKMMVDDDYLWAVVSLPSGVFQPYSGVKTNILLFDRQLAKKTNKILFVKVENDGFDLGAQRREIKRNDLPQIKTLLQKYKQALTSGDEFEVGQEFALSVVAKMDIRSSDYNLDANRYEENFHTNVDFPLVKLEEVLDYEQPTKYLVESVEYDNSYKTPVLTAGKSFLLGYTNETEGIYNEDLPVIIFDDFTTATQIVDFAFKVKSSALKILKSKKEKADIKYLYYVIQGIKFDSSKHKRYWISEYSKLEIPLPPLSVQQEIVDELDRYQKIIDGVRQVVENYKPSFKIEDDWDVIKLIDSPVEIIDGDRGKNYPKKEEFTKEGYCLFLNTKNVRANGFLLNELEFISKERDELLGKGKLKKNDVVLTTRGTVGNVGWNSEKIPYQHIRINSGMVILRAESEKISPEYLYYFLQSIFFKNQVHQMVSGSAQPQLPIRTLNDILIAIPSLSEQADIVSEIKEASSLVQSSKMLITKFEAKIKVVIEGIWGK